MDNKDQVPTIWNRSFLVALFGYFFLFMSITLFFLFPLFLKQFNPPQSRIGLIMGVHSLMAIFVRPFIGRLVDIRGRKKISLFGIGFLILILPFFHLVKDAGCLPLLLRALMGLGWGVSMTATLTICSDLAPVERLAHSMGIIGVAGLLSSALGPMLAEEVINQFGFTGLFNTSIILLAASFVCVLSTKEVMRPDHERSFQKPQSLRGVSVVIILLISTLPVVHGAIRGAVVYFIALFGKSIPLDRVGPFFLFFSAAAILARLGIGDISDRYGRKKVIFPAVCIISFNLFLISQVRSFWMFILAGFIGGFGQGLIFPALSTYIIDILGRENKGLAISLYLTLFDVGMGTGSTFFGWISDLYGYRNMYMFAGMVFFLVSVIFTWKAPSSR
ncbi:MAG: MFS transporter [Candidatus Aminicenantes bacterium]